ncbi:MAG: PQQ-binding-like beta-propeller repeat protein [Planctomycetota bacterium]|nr:PQQ-binding-like beta-propeller repeat protein [Planctomycetota bacterium]MDA1113647.1 PQQ-binding-like beta-propeller repeat protein [Planctomycetota bacterium]
MPSLLMLAVFGAQVVAQEDLPEGISLPENRILATKISDAQAYLADERWEAAVGLLQEVADADPSALIADQDFLYIGAVQRAQSLLSKLPAAAIPIRESLIAARAELELEEAMRPPDVHLLELIAQRYSGSMVGDRANVLLQELWYDRGYPQLALAQGAAPLSPEWQAQLPPRPPFDALAPPVFQNLSDPALPRLRPMELDPAWRFSFDDDAPTADLGHRMAFGNGLGFATNGREVVALELGSGQPRWHFHGPPGWSHIGSNDRNEITDGSSPLTLLAPVLADGIVLAVIQEPVGIGRSDSYSRIPIRKKLPARRLYAFDAVNGDILWKQEVTWMDPENRNPIELAAGPPAVSGGRVYLPVYTAAGTIDLSLLAFDLHTGKRLWKRFLVSGTMETNLFGNVLSELAVPPPVADLERVYVCTHFGAICAVDAATGNAIWTRTYTRTTVRTRQNGQIGSRARYFHNNPPAYDGKRLVVAPTDSMFAMTLDAEDGRRLSRWVAEANNNLYGTLSNLIGMDEKYAWFSGTHVARLPLEENVTQRPQTSPPLYEFVSLNASNLNAGALTHKSVLAMSSNGVVELDPDALSIRAGALTWEELEGRFIGPAQVTHGLVLLMTSKGIIAFASPGALLDTLVAHDLTPELLRELLPLLEAVRYEEDPGLGHRIARTASDLAKRDLFAAQAEELHFLAGRTLLLVGETRKGLSELGDLLDSANNRLRLNAASLILDAQPEIDVTAKRLQLALDIVKFENPDRVLTRGNHMEPRSAALLRAEALRALDGRDAEAQRAALVSVLLLEDAGSLQVGNLSLHVWARALLDTLIQDPGMGAAHQKAALSRLEVAPPNLAFLRAYANTKAAQDWMQIQLQDTQLDQVDRMELMAWSYRFGAKDRSWPSIPAMLQHQEALPPLPTNLTPLVSVKLDGALPLHSISVDGAAYVFLQDDNQCQILRLAAEGSRLLHTVDFLPGSSSLPNLEKYRFGTKTGIAVLYKDRWIHIDYRGLRQERLLNMPLISTSTPSQIGSFVAVLLSAPGRQAVVSVLDLETGVPYLQQALSATADRYLHIVTNQDYLHVLQDRSSTVYRVNLLREEEVVTFELPFAPRWDELQAVASFGDGIAIPTTRTSPQGAILIESPNRPSRSISLQGLDFSTFRVKEGIGWWTRPQRGLGADLGPLTLNWLRPSDRRTWTHRFLDPAVRVPQFLTRLRHPDVLDGTEFLALQPAARDQAEVQCLEMGELETKWTSLLTEIPFSHLVEPTPRPQRGDDGWVLLLREGGSRRAATSLSLLLFNEQGLLQDSYTTPSTARSLSSQYITLMPGMVLLRNGDLITLLGNQ